MTAFYGVRPTVEKVIGAHYVCSSIVMCISMDCIRLDVAMGDLATHPLIVRVLSHHMSVVGWMALRYIPRRSTEQSLVDQRKQESRLSKSGSGGAQCIIKKITTWPLPARLPRRVARVCFTATRSGYHDALKGDRKAKRVTS